VSAPVRSMLLTAAARAVEAARLRSDNPGMTLEEIGAEIGVSKQRVGQMLRKPPQERWPEDLLVAMCEVLGAGGTPQDVLAVPGVAERIMAERPRGRLLEDADREQAMKRLGNLRKLISTGRIAPEGTVSKRLYDARQRGIETIIAAMPERIVAATTAALRAGAKYAAVLTQVPELGEAFGGDRDRQATMLRIVIDSGNGRPVGTTGRRLFDARKAGLKKS